MKLNKSMNKDLIDVARRYLKKSYSPYSKFPVGAAVETKDGNIYGGCNVENSSYGLTVCAERVAIFKAVSEGHTQFKSIAVSCGDKNKIKPENKMPCGACRQVIAEFFPPDAPVIVDGVGEFTVEGLLPNSFALK